MDKQQIKSSDNLQHCHPFPIFHMAGPSSVSTQPNQLLTLASPDHTGLTQRGEVLNFWIHHSVLAVIPIYLILSGHYTLDKTNHYYFLLAVCIGVCFFFSGSYSPAKGLIHYDIMLVAALMSGHNVSYMLFPPPGISQFLCWMNH